MQKQLIRLLFSSLLALCLHGSLLAADPMPRPVRICSGANIIIKGDLLSQTSSSYSWEFYQGNSWVNAPGVQTELNYLATPLYNPSTLNITYTLRRKTVISGLPVYDSYYLVTVEPILPIINNEITLPLVHTFCSSGTPATIIGSSPASGSATIFFQWQSAIDDLHFENIDGANSKDYTPGEIKGTTYLRRIAMSDGCGLSTISSSIKLSVSSALANNVINPAALNTFCGKGDPDILTGVVPSGGNDTYVYSWQKSTDNLTFTDISGANASNYDPPTLTTTTYFRRTVVAEPCNLPLISNVISIRVMPELLVPELERSALSICSGTSTTLSVKNPIVGITYQWYDSPALTKLLFVGESYVTGNLSSDKTFYVTGSNGTCSSASLGIAKVTVMALPGSTFIANDGKEITCTGSSAVFTVAVPNAAFTYNWYAAAKGGMAIGSGSTWTTPAVLQSTTYYLELVNKEGCSSATRQAVTVTVMPALAAPTVAIESTTQHSITFKWTPVKDAVGYKVSLDNGLSFIDPNSGSQGLTHTVEGLLGNQRASILVKAVGTLACQEGATSGPSAGETLKEFDDIFVPNAFTPNGDGKNDVVYVRSQTLKTMAFYIYSQWGEQLFYSSSISKGWDGTRNSANQALGVYVYVLKATMNDGRQINKKGTITLIR